MNKPHHKRSKNQRGAITLSNTPKKDTQDQTYFWIPIYDDYTDGLVPVPIKDTNSKEE